MSGETATVETLTAEVRVLMVGNRQVTLSVYRQLDWVDPDAIEPFGRVNDAKTSAGGSIQVVGRHAGNGTLVRSECERPGTEPYTGPPEFGHWLAHQQKAPPYDYVTGLYKGTIVAERGPTRLRWAYIEKHVAACPRRGKYPPQECSVDTAELEATWRTLAKEQLELECEYRAWYGQMRALPLIVLAGLR